jgi:hypothetical protein
LYPQPATSAPESAIALVTKPVSMSTTVGSAIAITGVPEGAGTPLPS